MPSDKLGTCIRRGRVASHKRWIPDDVMVAHNCRLNSSKVSRRCLQGRRCLEDAEKARESSLPRAGESRARAPAEGHTGTHTQARRAHRHTQARRSHGQTGTRPDGHTARRAHADALRDSSGRRQKQWTRNPYRHSWLRSLAKITLIIHIIVNVNARVTSSRHTFQNLKESHPLLKASSRSPPPSHHPLKVALIAQSRAPHHPSRQDESFLHSLSPELLEVRFTSLQTAYSPPLPPPPTT